MTREIDPSKISLTSHSKIDENFANYFLKTKAKDKCYNVSVKDYRKHKLERRFIVDPVFKIVYKQTESICILCLFRS